MIAHFIIIVHEAELASRVCQLLTDAKIQFTPPMEELPRHISVRMPWSQFQEVKSWPEVMAIEPVKDFSLRAVQIISSQTDNWGLDRIHERQRQLDGQYVYSRTGQGVDIYIIDSGIQLNHNDFDAHTNNPRALPLWDYRAGLRLNGTPVWFSHGDDLDTIVSRINAELPGLALNSSGYLRLNFSVGDSLEVLDSADPYVSPAILQVLGLTANARMTGPVTGTKINPVINSASTSVPRYAWDDYGHGTHVAGIAMGTTYGVAKRAQALSAKCFTRTGNSNTAYILAAFRAVVAHHRAKVAASATSYRPSVANMSFGGPADMALDAAVEDMIRLWGIHVCVSAGNSSINAYNTSPARAGVASLGYLDGSGVYHDTVVREDRKPIVVACSNRADAISNFSNFSSDGTLSGTATSNYGSIVDIIAPGEEIRSAGYSEYTTSDSAIKSGTSMSAPHVSGVLALHLENGWRSTVEVRNQIITESTANIVTIPSQTNIQDRTPNRLLYQPYQATSVTWATASGLLATVNEGNPIAVTVQATTSDGSALSYFFPVQGSTAPSSGFATVPGMSGLQLNCRTGVIQGTAPSITTTTTDYNFVVRARDVVGNYADQTFTIRVRNVNLAPLWVTPAGTLGSFTEGSAVTIQLAATDPDNDPYTFILLNGSLPSGLTLSRSGQISGVVQVTGGTQVNRFTVRLSDGSSYVDREFSITVTEINEAPAWNPGWLPSSVLIKSPSRQAYNLGTFNIGDFVDIQPVINDPDGDALHFTVETLGWTDVLVGDVFDPDGAGPLTTVSIRGVDELPDGITVDPTTGRITGVIGATNPLGAYVFGLAVRDPVISETDPPRLLTPFMFVVADIVEVDFGPTTVSMPEGGRKQLIARLPGGSKVTQVTMSVTHRFNGVRPRITIGDDLVTDRLMTSQQNTPGVIGNYISTPNVKYNQTDDIELFAYLDDDSSQAQAYAVLENSVITAINVINQGSGYVSAPPVDIRFGGGSGASAISLIGATTVTVANPGTGYQVGNVLRIQGGVARNRNISIGGNDHIIERFTTIQVLSINSGGAIDQIQILDPGYYYTAPSLPASSLGGTPGVTPGGDLIWQGSDGTGATFNIVYGVKTVEVTSGGIGYLGMPLISFPGYGITQGTATFSLKYIPTDTNVFFGNIKWITPPGLLGELYELEPSYFKVEARASGNFPVSYRIAPGSAPLPLGFELNSSTGEISGIGNFIGADVTYEFTIRASNGSTYSDRTFRFKHRKRYSSFPLMGLKLQLTGWDRIDFEQFGFVGIPNDALFRPRDPSFGLVRDPYLHIIFGLNGVSSERMWEALSGVAERPQDLDHHQKAALYFGEIKTAVVRDNNGKVIYEVLYRELVDPQYVEYVRNDGAYPAHAGGFTETTPYARVPVMYPQATSINNRDNIQQIYPDSIHNMRQDLIADVGLNGGEGLPTWMTSPQIDGNANSIPGYVPSVTIAYLKPGQSQRVIRSIRNSQDGFDPIKGRQLILDRYLITEWNAEKTTFDLGIKVCNPRDYSWMLTDPDISPVLVWNLQGSGTYIGNAPPDTATFNQEATLAKLNTEVLPNLSGSRLTKVRSVINASGAETTFDDNETRFDFVLVQSSQYMKFAPGDTVGRLK